MKKITEEELKTILEQHKLWLDSNKKEGKCADLSDADLTEAGFTGANLFYTHLSSCIQSLVRLTQYPFCIVLFHQELCQLKQPILNQHQLN